MIFTYVDDPLTVELSCVSCFDDVYHGKNSNNETLESDGERSWVTNTWTMFVEKVLISLLNINLYCLAHTINHIDIMITSTSIASHHCMNMPYQHSLHCLICKSGCWFTISKKWVLYKLCYQIYLSMLKYLIIQLFEFPEFFLRCEYCKCKFYIRSN